MIKITDLKTQAGSTRNIYYSKGINHITFNDDVIFDILSYGKYNEELGNIKLIFDNEEFSASKRTNKILNFITVNVAKITSFKAVFVVEKENKNSVFQAFKDAILPLKEMEVIDEKSAKEKLNKAIECVSNLNVQYLLFDANVNEEFSSILSEVIAKHINDASYIFIRDKKDEKLEIKLPEPVKKVKPKKACPLSKLFSKFKKNNKKETTKEVVKKESKLLETLKEVLSYTKVNFLYLVSDLLFTFGSTFSLFGIVYFIQNWDLTILIIFSIIYLLFIVPFGDSMYRLFFEKYRDDQKMTPPLSTLIIFSLIGYGISIAVTQVFISIDFFYVKDQVTILQPIIGYSNLAILVIECVLCFFIGKNKGLKEKLKLLKKKNKQAK